MRNMFGYGNYKLKHLGARLNKRVATFDMLAGHTCPMANDCHARVIMVQGHRRIQKMGKFMCYAAKSEALYPATYKLHKINRVRAERPTFEKRAIAEIRANKIEIMRIHSSGDFYNFDYFQKWYRIAQALPDVSFFGYTKQATFVKWLLAHPLPNLHIVYSHGGLLDRFAAAQNLPTCYVETATDKYPDVPLACDAVHSDDYDYVVGMHNNGVTQSFKIAFH